MQWSEANGCFSTMSILFYSFCLQGSGDEGSRSRSGSGSRTRSGSRSRSGSGSRSRSRSGTGARSGDEFGEHEEMGEEEHAEEEPPEEVRKRRSESRYVHPNKMKFFTIVCIEQNDLLNVLRFCFQ